MPFSPSESRTRAMDCFLLPVATIAFSAVSAKIISFLLKGNDFRPLGLLFVFAAAINQKMREHAVTEPVFGKHALYRAAQDFIRTPGQQFFKRVCLAAAGISRVMIVYLVLQLFSRNADMTGVGDNHIIA